MEPDAETSGTAGRLGRAILRHKWIATLIATSAVAVPAFFFVNSHRIDSAPDAGNSKCSKVVDRSPDEVASEPRDWAIGEGVASWGDRSTILRCGVDELAPTINLCVSIDGVDWVLDEKKLHATGVSVLTTYGRSPAIQITYSGNREDVGGILVELKDSVDWIKQKRKCVGYDDTF
ncbi:DUF3515 family protein [Streptomyces justiciae]|uniref:DUF3515 family protein n=1 Tax=Streptomyces justiciae TaxID=2780140 RepID=UPI0021173296|nr:DUF3515 family protein [Streptomyces justiciae]MCW8384482.1 DUF3515 domain-containing protein [Streptomyces justiciae]